MDKDDDKDQLSDLLKSSGYEDWDGNGKVDWHDVFETQRELERIHDEILYPVRQSSLDDEDEEDEEGEKDDEKLVKKSGQKEQ